MSTDLKDLLAIMPFAGLIGMELDEAGPDRVVAHLTWSPPSSQTPPWPSVVMSVRWLCPGTGIRCHALPFHSSRTGTPMWLISAASHTFVALTARAYTGSRNGPLERCKSGSDACRQARPFQRTARLLLRNPDAKDQTSVAETAVAARICPTVPRVDSRHFPPVKWSASVDRVFPYT